MGIIDDYLNSDTDDKSVSTKANDSSTVPTTQSSIIDKFLNAPDTVERSSTPSTITIRPKPFTPAEEIEAAKPKANPRDSDLLEGIKNIPSSIGQNTAEAFKAGTSLASQGLEDVTKGNILDKAKGIGEIGLGALGAATSPVSGGLKTLVENPVTQVTGNPKAGEAASMIVGSAVPIIPSAKAISNLIPKNSALKTLVDSIGPENLQSVVSQMKANPRLSTADLSPKVMQDTQHLFTVDGPHINQLAKTVEDRVNGAKGAVESSIANNLGATVNPVEKLNELKQNIRNVGSKEIAPVVLKTNPVDLTPVIKNIDDQLKPGVSGVISSGQLPLFGANKELEKLRGLLTDDKAVMTDPVLLHKLQSLIRQTSERMLKSPDPSQRQLGYTLKNVRNDIVNAIDEASPQVNGKGTYKPTLAKYRDEAHIEDAFEHGHDSILAGGKKLTDRPEFFKEWVKKASKEELNAAREGALISFDTQINGFKHAARRGTDIGQVEFNKEKIKALFGEAKANKMFQEFEHERKIADTNNKLIQGSQTAMRNASKEAFDLPKPSDPNRFIPPALMESASILGGAPGVGTALYMGARGATKLKDMVKGKLQREHNARYTQLALPNTAQERQALIDTLDRLTMPKPKQSLIRRGAGTLVQVIKP